ncbi:uncharacterized protein LAESUDRAFT_249617 [Laetiporus sulphureus 93-53]|uniref:Uncharacterized protein n=1 Tax=Laetiporus sulphureus 93-53 TaxID=1314785 RepID=A0A165DIY5_9APHY|nr:uncharacterized protein LAESUDRAFT_249617 [Laetiporus sulphureus 93-53]KZT04986.1 hypothetical protein LAESUDRAFT_249617 [Laetiporus sulphureus 93-53]
MSTITAWMILYGHPDSFVPPLCFFRPRVALRSEAGEAALCTMYTRNVSGQGVIVALCRLRCRRFGVTHIAIQLFTSTTCRTPGSLFPRYNVKRVIVAICSMSIQLRAVSLADSSRESVTLWTSTAWMFGTSDGCRCLQIILASQMWEECGILAPGRYTFPIRILRTCMHASPADCGTALRDRIQ